MAKTKEIADMQTNRKCVTASPCYLPSIWLPGHNLLYLNSLVVLKQKPYPFGLLEVCIGDKRRLKTQ
ncbi:hypothetical protein ACFL1G_10705 [Planctomycetota bacterium]